MQSDAVHYVHVYLIHTIFDAHLSSTAFAALLNSRLLNSGYVSVDSHNASMLLSAGIKLPYIFCLMEYIKKMSIEKWYQLSVMVILPKQ